MHPIAKELSCQYECHEGPYVTGRVALLLGVEVDVSPSHSDGIAGLKPIIVMRRGINEFRPQRD
jgi:hypothetical protein